MYGDFMKLTFMRLDILDNIKEILDELKNGEGDKSFGTDMNFTKLYNNALSTIMMTLPINGNPDELSKKLDEDIINKTHNRLAGLDIYSSTQYIGYVVEEMFNILREYNDIYVLYMSKINKHGEEIIYDV